MPNLNILSCDAINTIGAMDNLYYRHRCYHHESSGIIRYEPERHGTVTPWSAIIEVDKDLADYYRLLFNIYFKNRIMKPSWAPHISLFRGDLEYHPKMQLFWKELDGTKVTFQYNPNVFWNNDFAWINVYCPEYFYLREKMGLGPTHEDNELWGHITIGKFRKPGALGNFTDYTYAPTLA